MAAFVSANSQPVLKTVMEFSGGFIVGIIGTFMLVRVDFESDIYIGGGVRSFELLL